MQPRNQDVRGLLLRTATRLFAEHGIDGVSLREIVREAGVKHATAVQYHFGGRDGLLSSVLDEHHQRVDTRRDAMLAQAGAAQTADPRLLAEILVRPLAAELDDEQGRLFLRVYAEMIVRSEHTMTDDGTSVWRWREFVRSTAIDSPDELHPRFAALTYAAITLSRRAVAAVRADDRLLVSRLIDIVSAILTAPVSDETRRHLSGRQARTVEPDTETT